MRGAVSIFLGVAIAHGAQFLQQVEDPMVQMSSNLERNRSHSLHGVAANSTLDAEFDEFLNAWFEEFISRRPVDGMSFDGRLPKGCGSTGSPSAHLWGDPSMEAEAKAIKQDEARLAEMERRFGSSLGNQESFAERYVSYRVMQEKVNEMKQEHLHADFRLPFGSMGCRVSAMGCQVRVAGLLRGIDVKTEEHGRCFAQLLAALPQYLNGHEHRLRDASARGAVPYRSVLEKIHGDCQKMLPDEGDANPDPRQSEMFKTFEEKLAKSSIAESSKAKLLNSVEHGIEHGMWVAYRSLAATAEQLMSKGAPREDKGLESSYGASGRASYTARLKLLGIKQSAAELHQHALTLIEQNKQALRRMASEGLPEVEQHRLANAEFPTVLKELQVRYLSEHYPDTEEGRNAYLSQMKEYIDGMWKRLADRIDGSLLFISQDVPQVGCDVKRIWSPSFPAMAQYSAGLPGHHATVAFKLVNMSMLPKAEMQALAYHEVVPGHHLQVSRATSLQSALPAFRRFFGDEAFSEGWAVYAEQDISRRLVNMSTAAKVGLLNMLQVRVVRTVVDTGLHSMNWDREQAQKYYLENCILDPAKAEQFVFRHFAWPGQQLSYLTGYEEIRKLRARFIEKSHLRSVFKYDLDSSFHDALVSHGDLPLSLVEDVVAADLRRRGAAVLPPI